jgi:hypothetical protein
VWLWFFYLRFNVAGVVCGFVSAGVVGAGRPTAVMNAGFWGSAKLTERLKDGTVRA